MDVNGHQWTSMDINGRQQKIHEKPHTNSKVGNFQLLSLNLSKIMFEKMKFGKIIELSLEND